MKISQRFPLQCLYPFCSERKEEIFIVAIIIGQMCMTKLIHQTLPDDRQPDKRMGNLFLLFQSE